MSEERPSNITNPNTKQIGNNKFNGLYCFTSTDKYSLKNTNFYPLGWVIRYLKLLLVSMCHCRVWCPCKCFI